MLRLVAMLTAAAGPTLAQSNWGAPAEAADTGFSWTDPIAPGFWMAWTNTTAAFFVFIFACIALLAVIEVRHPGGAERRGILGLVTTRGDRLFIGLLGSAYFFLAWLGFLGEPLWTPLGLAVAWLAFCFWRV
jgi:predicted small integral membrane protein